MKTAILFDKFGPYHVARLVAAAQHMDVIALEASPTNNEYAWDRPTLPDTIAYLSAAQTGDRASQILGFRAWLDEKLAILRPDCVAVPGWSSWQSLELTRWCVAYKIPVVGMSDTNEHDAVRTWVAETVKRAIVAHFSAALVAGPPQGRYLHKLGLARDRLFVGYDVVDNDYFSSNAAAARKTRMMPSINGQPLPESWRGRCFLASNRFIEKKNLPALLRAYARFRAERTDDPADWPLVMLGDGELGDQLKSQTTALGLDGHVHYPGFRQYDELPLFYAAAGALVHVSTVEQWGLVINEAMASGVPAIVSNRCGCAEVLVDDGVNGLLIDPYDEASIVAALEAMAAPGVQARLAAAATLRIAEWGPDRFGQGMHDAMVSARTTGPKRPGMIAKLMLKFAAQQVLRLETKQDKELSK